MSDGLARPTPKVELRVRDDERKESETEQAVDMPSQKAANAVRQPKIAGKV